MGVIKIQEFMDLLCQETEKEKERRLLKQSYQVKMNREWKRSVGWSENEWIPGKARTRRCKRK